MQVAKITPKHRALVLAAALDLIARGRYPTAKRLAGRVNRIIGPDTCRVIRDSFFADGTLPIPAVHHPNGKTGPPRKAYGLADVGRERAAKQGLVELRAEIRCERAEEERARDERAEVEERTRIEHEAKMARGERAATGAGLATQLARRMRREERP